MPDSRDAVPRPVTRLSPTQPERRRSVVEPLRDRRAFPDLGDLTVTVVFPALDEAEGLEATLPVVPSYVHEVIVVDGGSRDKSLDVVRRLRPNAVVIHQDGRGKGNALKLGIRAATGDIVVTMDCDGSMDPLDINAAIARLLAGDDFVKGSRCLPGGGSDDFTAVRKAGNSFLTGVTNRLVGRHFTDITYGFNAYWREMGHQVHDLAEGFEFEIQLAVRAARSGLRTSEVPCHEATRVGGASKLHAVRDGWRILRSIVHEVRSGHRSPLRPVAGVFPARDLADTELIVDRDAVG